MKTIKINRKSNAKKYEKIPTKLKSFGTIGIIATTSSSITLSLTGIVFIVIPISTATACGILIGDKVLYGINMQKYNKYKEQYQKHHQTDKSFDRLFRKGSQDNPLDKKELESLSKNFNIYFVDKKNLFYKYEHFIKSKSIWYKLVKI